MEAEIYSIPFVTPRGIQYPIVKESGVDTNGPAIFVIASKMEKSTGMFGRVG